MRKLIPILIVMSFFAGNLCLAFADDFVGCVKISTPGHENGKVECFEFMRQNNVQNFKNIQPVIQGAAEGDKFRLIKGKNLYQLVQFNSDSGCLSVHQITLNLEKLATYAMPCGLAPMEDLQGTMDQKGNMFLVLGGHDSGQNYLGKLTVVKMSPRGEFRMFPVLLNSALHHPNTYRNLKIAISEYSNAIYVAYVQAGLDDEFGDLQIVSLDAVTGTVKDNFDFNFRTSPEDENIQLATNYMGQTFAVLGGINEEGIQGIFSMQEEFMGTWSGPTLIRSGAQEPKLILMDSDLIYMTSKGLEGQEMWLDILSSQAKSIINTLNYSTELAINFPNLGNASWLMTAPDALGALKEFSPKTAEIILIGLERKI